MWQQVMDLKEANIAARAELEEARKDLAHSEKSVDALIRSATESKNGRQEALVEFKWMKRALDIEIVWSLRCCKERESLKVEKSLLQDESHLLRDAVKALDTRVDSSFQDEYLFASYEVAKALPSPFDLQVAFKWNKK